MNQKTILDTIMNPDYTEEEKINLFSDYFSSNTEDETLDLLSRIISMYKYTGLKSFVNFLFSLTKSDIVSPLLRVEAAYGLSNYREQPETIEPWDDKQTRKAKEENNIEIQVRNEEHIKRGYEALNNSCSVLGKLSFAYRTQVISCLIQSHHYQEECMVYFLNAIEDLNIDCKFRYNFILSLECLKDTDNFVRKGCVEILYEGENPILYRILAAQYLLTKFYKTNDEDESCRNISVQIQYQVSHIMLDEKTEYNLRADCADLLLNLGSEDMQKQAKKTILSLGGILDKDRTIFDNAQNVHTKDIEESVSNILSKLTSIYQSNKDIEFATIVIAIYKAGYDSGFLKCQKEPHNEIDCHECKIKAEKKVRIDDSLDRIKFDRKQYTLSLLTLQHVLKSLWSYILESEHKEELTKRLLEELDDMSGTCSSGFASRLANVLSGYDFDYSIKISFDDQLVSNFVGRMNARIAKMHVPNSPFLTTRKFDMIENYIRSNLGLKDTLIKEVISSGKDKPTMRDCAVMYLEKEPESKLENALYHFYDNVISEMAIETYKAEDKPNFLLFVLVYLDEVRNELYEEFKEYMTDTEFDNAIRKAISVYEGVKITI